MTGKLRLAVVGAGLIGKCHVAAIRSVPAATLACIVDPSGAGQKFARSCGVDCYGSLQDMFAATSIDGAILATPSPLHVEGALLCVEHGCPVLVEKPLGVTAGEAEKLVAAAGDAGVPVLTGHHRRHGAVVKKACSIIGRGDLGTIVSFHGTCWFHKPDDYFDTAWRSQPGGGPVFINLIHDINTMLCLFGDVASVQALQSSTRRRSEVEDTAALLLGFHSGAMGTLSVSDVAASPWSWEMTSGENPAYPTTSQPCYLIAGTHGSLSMPDMTFWRHKAARSWHNPMQKEILATEDVDPLVAQIRQFLAVIRGDEPPLVSGLDGLRTLRVIEAVKTSARTGQKVLLARGPA